MQHPQESIFTEKGKTPKAPGDYPANHLISSRTTAPFNAMPDLLIPAVFRRERETWLRPDTIIYARSF